MVSMVVAGFSLPLVIEKSLLTCIGLHFYYKYRVCVKVVVLA